MENQKIDLETILNSEYLKDFDEPKLALSAAKIWELTLEECSEMIESPGNYGYGKIYSHPYISGEYWVINSDDVDDAFRAYQNDYIDEFIIPELEKVSDYLVDAFDYNSYIEDLKVNEGYGILSTYDGNSNEVNLDGEFYYVFRLN